MNQPNSRSTPRGQPGATTPRPRRFGFALWVGAAAALLVVAMAVFQVYDIVRRHALVIENTEHLFASLVRAMGEQTARSLQTVDVVVRDTAASGDSRQDLQAAQRRLRDRVLAVPQIRQLLVFDADGHVLASSANVDPPVRSIAEQAYFQTHRDKPGALPQISIAAPLSGKGPGTIVLSRRIDDSDGRFAGVAAAYIDLGYFNRFYASLNLGQGTALTLLGRDSVVLASYPNTVAEIGRPYLDAATVAALLAASPPPSTLAASPPPSTVVQRAANAGDMIYAAERVPDFPLAVVASIDEDVVLRAWHVQALHSTARTTLLCVSVVLLMWLMLRQLRRRERAEERLRVQTAQLDELFESAPEAIVMLDLGQRVTRVNREFTRMFGYTAHQARGHTLERLIVPADLLDESRWMDEALSRGQRVSRETERAGKDGARVHVTLLGAPIVAATGQIASYAIYRDITERRLAEAEHTKLETRLRQAEKLEAIGTMAGGIAHDFNNILSAILGYGDMALTAAPEAGPLKRYMNHLMAGAHRARALVDQILTYSQSTRGKRSALNVSALVEETLDLVRASLPTDIVMHSQIAEHKASVIGDPIQIHQLLMNLCTNAIHAMKSGGTLSVSLDAIDVPADRELSHGLLPAGHHLRLAVHDTGCGMDASVTAHIFQPFFTTRESGRGTGLGLALVHGIVTEMGGAIDVASKLGEGSLFEIYLPGSDAAAIELATREVPLQRGQGQRILVVEDEVPLMLLAEEMLAALGYEPAGFTRPDEALIEFRADPSRFDALILDQLMPGMTGIELARRMREARPDIPVLLFSGYMGPLLHDEALAAGVDQLLTKPLDLRRLSDAIAQALSQPGLSQPAASEMR